MSGVELLEHEFRHIHSWLQNDLKVPVKIGRSNSVEGRRAVVWRDGLFLTEVVNGRRSAAP